MTCETDLELLGPWDSAVLGFLVPGASDGSGAESARAASQSHTVLLKCLQVISDKHMRKSVPS